MAAEECVEAAVWLVESQGQPVLFPSETHSLLSGPELVKLRTVN